MNRPIWKTIPAAVLLIALTFPAQAQQDSEKQRVISSIEEGVRVIGGDAKAIATAPAHWDRARWQRVGLFTAGLVALSFADQEIADAVQRNRSDTTDRFAKAVTPFGGGRALQLSALMAVTGMVVRDERLRDTGIDALEAEWFAAGLITPSIKRLVGRDRPIAGDGEHDFDPFSKQQSFPSGHATNAFALASVVSAHYDGWVVPGIAWTVASSVAAARMNDNAHFATDVIAGATIGTSVGRLIVRRHETLRAAGIDDVIVVPYAGTEGRGVVVRLSIR